MIIKPREELIKIYDKSLLQKDEPVVQPKYDLETKAKNEDFRNYSISYSKD
jgi:hypothetical protein|tara:strand:- start:800 stop:952 length:153 start_codon:yes stop_codon:yes gene_type:complete